ncbi:FtsW/RodA/SpoVE family cell cycle protein [Entomospira culicis]|uniref:Probable peptidoglycan glycosyltransferase FtsW n=1 Tax=Entomospira culicis TaxID=2719989 RepID=A0A968KUZ9_9SPIO|nr:FtsW/RodA/SpoVE family cell cycle protein [Entomospira culicis]NIZ19445.1 FtsW/RodA/SpoVE family cell cycle protein [Entomospira culicis]NIZ69650.1 FtsW/RodA/SpoVE family cell cycle protein [Entomospira culicis]WDI36761.1 FtsW/RodA/SpoVE family cell cycle protein [Entomospira culicis]WDI38390.1 FtsW/RodA/SpoVE family cell cycle protein [Entomospira culicis]
MSALFDKQRSKIQIRIKAKRTLPRWLSEHRWIDLQRGAVDLELLLVILALILFGFVITFSGYFYFSWQQYSQKGTPLLYFISRQAIWLMLGFISMIFLSLISPRAIHKATPIFFILVLLLNLMPVFGILGQEIRGGRRWIFLGGFSFQPSELAKLALVLYLARIVNGHRERLATSFAGALRPMLMVTLLGLSVFFQNDLSTSVFLFGIAILILFMGGISLRYLVIQLAMMLGMSILAIISTPFRIQRVLLWLSGDGDLTKNGRQAILALRAIENSGIGGTGLGAGEYKLGRISLVQSDYIFAAVVEELGFLGIMSVIGLFLLLLVKAYDIGQKTKKHYTSFLAIALATTLAGQAFLNMAVVVGIFPVTGLPLPFFSAGGSNLLVSMMMCGILLNLSRKEGRT